MDNDIGSVGQKNSVTGGFVYGRCRGLVTEDHGLLVAGAFEDGHGEAVDRGVDGAVDVTCENMACIVGLQKRADFVGVGEVDPVHAGKAGIKSVMVHEDEAGIGAFGEGGLQPCQSVGAQDTGMWYVRGFINGIEQNEPGVGQVDRGLDEAVCVGWYVGEGLAEGGAVVVVADEEADRPGKVLKRVFQAVVFGRCAVVCEVSGEDQAACVAVVLDGMGERF